MGADSGGWDEIALNPLRQPSSDSAQSWRIGVEIQEDEPEVAASIASDLDDFEALSICGSDAISIKPKLKKRGTSCPDANIKTLQEYRGEISTAQVRVSGTLRTFTSFAGRVLAIGGVLANAALPVFIILDIVQGQWKAAAWALGATSAGIAADALASAAAEMLGAFAIAGPIGLFVGAVVGILFAILPGLFKKKHEPLTTNTTQIIQWAFFGDATHTGNEKCNQALEDNGQTPNCTVTYGPGTLSVSSLTLSSPEFKLLWCADVHLVYIQMGNLRCFRVFDHYEQGLCHVNS